MSSVYGKFFQVTIFGESHGKAVGCVVSGLPAGVLLDFDFIHRRIVERKNGVFEIDAYGESGSCEERLREREIIEKMITARKEADDYEVLSGVNSDGTTMGSPLSVIFGNRDARREDYREIASMYRPGHADFVSAFRSKGFADISGGGHFSGRLTAPLVFAGAIFEQMLHRKGIGIYSYVDSVGGMRVPHRNTSPKIEGSQNNSEQEFESFLQELREAGDSAGSLVKMVIDGMPVGVGEPFFETLEGELAKVIFAVPGVKGVEFGAGFEFASAKGSEVRDPFYLDGDTVRTITNFNGGINGGLSNGMPIELSVAVKPASSIAVPVETLDFKRRKMSTLKTNSVRHDAVIGMRALPALNAAVAMVLANFFK